MIRREFVKFCGKLCDPKIADFFRNLYSLHQLSSGKKLVAEWRRYRPTSHTNIYSNFFEIIPYLCVFYCKGIQPFHLVFYCGLAMAKKDTLHNLTNPRNISEQTTAAAVFSFARRQMQRVHVFVGHASSSCWGRVCVI